MDSNTAKFDLSGDRTADVQALMTYVLSALKEKGYNPISQIVGYILTEDPTYITTHNNARNLIRRVDRFELLQNMLKDYIKE